MLLFYVGGTMLLRWLLCLISILYSIADRKDHVKLEFRFKLIVKDAWGTQLCLYGVKSNASQFLGKEFIAHSSCLYFQPHILVFQCLAFFSCFCGVRLYTKGVSRRYWLSQEGDSITFWGPLFQDFYPCAIL